jgi:heme/copper-type cytochrome/quinol oxidase subunit 2
VPTVIHGLPAHVLLLHVVVVLLPLGALFTVLGAVWPAARRKLGFIAPLTCLVALIFVPITTNAGRWYQHYLERQAGGSLPAIDHHAALGHSMIWFAIGLFVVSTVAYSFGRYKDLAEAEAEPSRRSAAVLRSSAPAYAVAAAAIVMSGVAVWWLYRVGDSGAFAVYGGSVHS